MKNGITDVELKIHPSVPQAPSARAELDDKKTNTNKRSYDIDKFLIRILKWNFNWIEEQGSRLFFYKQNQNRKLIIFF